MNKTNTDNSIHIKNPKRQYIMIKLKTSTKQSPRPAQGGLLLVLLPQ